MSQNGPTAQPAQPAWAARTAIALALLLVGVVLGTASTLVHQGDVGVVLAVAAPAATVWALPGGWWCRFAFTAGWLVAVVYFLQTRPEGDFLVAADTRGYAVIGAGIVFLVFSVATLRPLRPPASAAPTVVPPSEGPIS